MSRSIGNLEPKEVWKYFADICAIPHPSHSEEAIREYIVEFAKGNGLEYLVDGADNVIIKKAATKGMEGRKGIILQSHLDMVPQKNSDKVFDFKKDAIEAYVDGEWVKAKGTTLGADNGIGVAATLAVLASKELVHGAVEALFTASEEVGMYGAFGLKAGLLDGKILMNLDSESEGELYVGCAGGVDVTATIDYKQVAPKNGYKAVEISIKGLRGGHSGLEIVLQRANANKVLFRFLRAMEAGFDIDLASVDGGGLRNAIPREARAVVMVEGAKVAEFERELKAYGEVIRGEYRAVEDEIIIESKMVDAPAKVIDGTVVGKLIKVVCGAPNGVIKMSESMEGLVQTSTNLARVVSDGKQITLQCLLRSSANSEKDALAGDVANVFELGGGRVTISGSYDGWNPDMNSPVLKTMKASYNKLYGVEPRVMAIHAGLECGIIAGVYPDLDMISFGPTIKYPHSPDEKVNIASVAKFWEFMCYTLENAPKK